MLNNHKKGLKRDKDIFNLLESQAALNTNMIQLLLFKRNCLRIVQRRLTKLYTQGKINRTRLKLGESYVYYMDKPGQLEHVLGVSWVYTWINSTLSNMEKINSFEREVKSYKIIRPDAFVSIKNLWQDAFYFYFVEMDIGKSGNDFSKKVKKYNDYYSSDAYMGMWWATLSKRFPAIIVVTTRKVQTIQEKIEKENKNNLEFRIYSLEQIKEECLNGCSSSAGIRAK